MVKGWGGYGGNSFYDVRVTDTGTPRDIARVLVCISFTMSAVNYLYATPSSEMDIDVSVAAATFGGAELPDLCQNITGCDALRECVERAMRAGTLPPRRRTQRISASSSTGSYTCSRWPADIADPSAAGRSSSRSSNTSASW